MRREQTNQTKLTVPTENCCPACGSEKYSFIEKGLTGYENFTIKPVDSAYFLCFKCKFHFFIDSPLSEEEQAERYKDENKIS